MQPLSLNFTTFSPRSLPPLVVRPRLLDRLQRQPAQGVILIQGQAAQGKTGLVADFLRSRQSKTAWVSVDTGNGAVGSFFKLLTGALQQAGTIRTVKEAMPPAQLQPIDENPDPWRHRLQQIWSDLPEDLEIVVDGLDRLGDNTPAQALIEELCLLSAHNCRLWLLSRRTASFTPLRACISRRLLTLHNTDLAFTPAETDLYFKTMHQMDPTPAWIECVHRLTDGWCGGLVLISQALERQPGVSCDDSDEKLFTRLAGEAFQFFGEDVFSTIPAPHQQFLLQAAAADIIDPGLIRRLPDMEDAPALLENLAGNLGFVQTLYDDPAKRTLYRLNPLFHEFLRSRFDIAFTPGQRHALYDRLGRLYDDHGDLAAAIPLYFKAGNIRDASEAIKKFGIDLVIKGRLRPLETWLEQLDPKQVRSDPWLFLLLTLARRIKGQAKSVEDFHLVWEQFSTSNDVRGQMITAAFLIEALVFQGRPPQAILTWVRVGEQLLTVQGETPYYAWAKLLLWLHIGFGYIAGGLDLAKGLSACRNALLLARKMGNDALIMQVGVIYSLGLIASGDYEQARQRLSALNPTPEPLPLLLYDVLKRLAGADIDMRLGDLTAAEEKLQSARDDIETQGLEFLYPTYVDATGRLQIVKQQYEKARQTARHLLDVSVLAGNPLLKAAAHRLGSLIDYHRQRYAQSAAEAGRALEILSSQGPDTLQAMHVLQLQAMACHHLEKGEQALPMLNRALDYFKATANTPALAETHLMLALVHQQHAPEVCRTHLNQGLVPAAPAGVNPFTILSPADHEKIGTLADRADESACTNQDPARRDQRFSPNRDRSAAASPNSFIAVDWRHAAPGWLDIRTLGGFAVQRDGRHPITDRQWGGSRPKLLFKALLVHGLREIPKDIIIDNLWPESDPQSAFQNFKVTLHRLRKILEPGLDKHKSSAFIQLKDNLVSLNKARCRVDLEEFLVCCKEIKRHTLSGESDQIAALGHHLMELYQGDFLPEEPYAPWMEMKRWALRDTYIDTILRVCAAHRELGRPEAAADCCRAAIQIDPFQERIIRELIQLYTHLGRPKDARDVFEQYRSALKQEFGLTPDNDTLALMEKIRGDIKHSG